MYIVLEMQTNGETTSLLSNTYADKNVAENKYHTILAYAAVSEVDVHTALIINEYGLVLKREQYEHKSKEVMEDERLDN